MIKNVHIWIFSYLADRIPKGKSENQEHILFCLCDHFEPFWGEGYKERLAIVKSWVESYPKIADKHRDGDGHPPRHTFFYAAEQYKPEYLDLLAELCREGYGEVEIHLHHDNDTSENLRRTLIEFKETLAFRHELLSQDRNTGEIRYGFIHGNWALDNSRRDGRWCGVNNELQVLRETGCYADFTYPSAPSDTQTRKINSIYYALDDPDKPKSHDIGVDVKVGGKPWGDLMIIQGPLALNWRNRKFGIFPRIENGAVGSGMIRPSPDRIDLWIKQGIHVKGRRNWIFVKVHCHGAKPRDMNFLLNQGLDSMFTYLGHRYNDREKYFLHYVTAREMYNIIKAAEAKRTGNPDDFRDFVLVKNWS